jgi:hypothetical protein
VSSIGCISDFGVSSGIWRHVATVRTPIPTCAANDSFVMRTAACSAQALRRVQGLTSATTRRPLLGDVHRIGTGGALLVHERCMGHGGDRALTEWHVQQSP